MSESTMPVSDAVQRLLREMAEWSNVSIEVALERAVREQHERLFWKTTNAGYAALRADPQIWADEEKQRRLWEATLMDGLDPAERWKADGTIEPVTRQGEAS